MILFLAANPSETGRVALDSEARSIHMELKRSGFRDRFDFQTRWASEPLDLLRELRELKPTVLHFSGHHGTGATEDTGATWGRDVVEPTSSGGDRRGLYFHYATGGARSVSQDAIRQTLEAAGASVKVARRRR